MSNYTAWMDDIHLLTIHIDELDPLRELVDQPPLIYWQKNETYFQTEFHQTINTHAIQFKHHDPLPIGEELTLLWGEQQFPIHPREITRTNLFDEMYAAPDAELGTICTQKETTFNLWTPVATAVNVNINGKIYPLHRGSKGVWSLVLKGDFHGCHYHYEAMIQGKTVIANDPYAKAMAANSKSGILLDFSRTFQLPTFDPPIKHATDAIIYELHIRDATIHPESGVVNKGKYLGLAEKNTKTSKGYSTGLSYFKELGITHIQLLPFHDYARIQEKRPETSYNWGYDPLYFQSPEGSYSLKPDHPTERINELKEAIHTIHKEGIGIIQDVVLNHVYVREESDFEKLVPGYYFRYHENGSLSNGTGVGNDLATERIMMRKFILDTIDFWLSEYKIDGFRFDLMGNMDIETIKQIKKRCMQEDRTILLYGEGWDLPTALEREKKAIAVHADQLKGIGFFNDYFRDTLKGKLFHTHDVGFVNGGGRFKNRLPHLIKGSVLVDGLAHHDIGQTINYVECHDNHTLWDRLALTNPFTDAETRKKMHQLATALTIVSQGVPFLHAGQEFFRTKYGIENSYISGDAINQLDWARREAEDDNVTFVKKLIQLRKSHPVFRLRSKVEVARRIHPLGENGHFFGFTLLGDKKDIAIFINPTDSNAQVKLPSPGKWDLYVTNVPNERKQMETIQGEQIVLQAYEVIVFEKNRY